MDHQSTTPAGQTGPSWTGHKRWTSGTIRDRSAENLVPIWIFTVVWNVLIAVAFISRLRACIQVYDRSRFIALLFPAVGLGLLIWALRRTRRITKFGASVFHLQRAPVTLGSDLAGTIHVARKFKAKSGIQFKLSCINRFVSGFGRRARVVDHVVWQETQTLDGLPVCDEGTDIPVLFHIPPDAEASSDLGFGDGIRWRLEARCKTGGVGYYSRFEIPISEAAPSELAMARGGSLASFPGFTEPADPRSKLSEPGILCERFGGHLRIQFAAARDKLSVILTTLIGLTLIAIAIGLANWLGFRMDRVIAISIAWTILLIAGVFDFIAIFNWLVSEEITVRYGSLTLERRAPLYLQQRTFKTKEISDIFHQIEGGSSFASRIRSQKEKSFYGLVLKTRDDDLIWLAKDIIQKDYAAWLAEEIKDTFGVVAEK